MKNWQPDLKRETCVRRFGNMKQLCGIRRYQFTDGRATGLDAADVETGGGLRFTVLPGRGMDISELRYKGMPVSYLTKAGVTASTFYDAHEDGWLKSFFAGMLTTCGLSNAGPYCRGDFGYLKDMPCGLHGNISNTCADNVCTKEAWEDGAYTLRLSGRMEEGRLHGEHLQLRRTIRTALGEKRFFIEDEFSNEGELPQMLMFFYHINIGAPILGESARFIAPSRRVWAETEHAKRDIGEYSRCGAPRAGYSEQQFFHEMGADRDGNTVVALVNDALEAGFYLRYNVRELPCIAQWKVLRDAEYVLAFEPGNCHAIGRQAQIDRGEQEILQPMQSRFSHLELGIVDGTDEIQALEEEIRNRRME